MKRTLTPAQLRTLLFGLYEQANNMLPVREKSYEEGQRDGFLTVARRIERIVGENEVRLSRGRKRSDA